MAAAAATRSSWKPLVKTAGIGFVGGVLIWGAGDVLGEFSTFWKLQQGALKLANENQELKDQIGTPFSVGPWYNASIGFAVGGKMAMCTFQLKGSKQITDISVKSARPGGGFSHKALYNIVGPGTWTIIDCTAMFPSGGGLVKPKSLMPFGKPGEDGDSSCPLPEQPAAAGSAPGAAPKVQVEQAESPGSAGMGAGDNQASTAGSGEEAPEKKRRGWWPFGSKGGSKGGAGAAPAAPQVQSSDEAVGGQGTAVAAAAADAKAQ